MPNFRGLNIPQVSFGSITSDDLFCDKEQALFDLYEKWGREKRYTKAVDIGANIGVHSILMHRAGFEVQGYEPDPEHFEIARMNVIVEGKLYVPEGREVGVWLPTIWRSAVSDHDGRETFVRVKGNTTGSHLKGDKQPYGELEEFTVRVVDCRPLFAWADLAKIDCEGHEARLLATVTPECRCEFLVEVGNEKNRRAIWEHFQGSPYRIWAQRLHWGLCTALEQLPKHHSEGAIFVGRRAP